MCYWLQRLSLLTNEERGYKLCIDLKAESCKYLHKPAVYEKNAT